MSLFDEIIETLNNNIRIIDYPEKRYVSELLLKFTNGDVNSIYFSENFKDVNFEDLKRMNLKGGFYILTDNIDIPLFESDIKSIINNIYDIVCLSTKIIILNQDILMYRLFPDDIFRIVFNKN
ncbi:CDI toxin immunity protein [Avibacterium paragallinarum]|uniref:Uncharacterized protein n=1 Tax=Avibacterium paragallinarum TaxID=728 RepID=A0AAE5TJL7_AVIPA|nr:hypothetical protein [Avibacterium paragallinarum]MEE3607482.1 hypothetical protein [Avibacterium paragallinarum]MEE3622296.1 hypothetical protein [Avibacterium paragallinarum]MEE3669048.1 hypothetical protein [Avibacterium paragallinarum]MEE3682042.1 hypothetical protein [Avibacterium paragallinarum]MEE4386489.1 hypothetical protein [Avibacterium paragallinarum]